LQLFAFCFQAVQKYEFFLQPANFAMKKWVLHDFL